MPNSYVCSCIHGHTVYYSFTLTHVAMHLNNLKQTEWYVLRGNSCTAYAALYVSFFDFLYCEPLSYTCIAWTDKPPPHLQQLLKVASRTAYAMTKVSSHIWRVHSACNLIVPSHFHHGPCGFCVKNSSHINTLLYIWRSFFFSCKWQLMNYGLAYTRTVRLYLNLLNCCTFHIEQINILHNSPHLLGLR